MTTSINIYTPSALNKLREHTEYEAWLLEIVYDIINQQLVAHQGAGHLIYPKNGGKPETENIGSANLIWNDWRPGFREAGAPLVFVTAFKLLDILMEWVLIKNLKLTHSTSKYCQKIKEIKKPAVLFPDLIENRSWLRERLIALYEKFEPLRGTIIHERHFTSTDGNLNICSSKGGMVGPNVTISADALRNIVHILVPLIRHIEEGKSLDIYQEKFLRYRLDTLTHFHDLPILGQLHPILLKVCLYDSDADPFEFNISKIMEDIAENYTNQDVASFDIHIADNTGATMYIIPWDKLHYLGHEFSMTRAELSDYAQSWPWPFRSIDTNCI